VPDENDRSSRPLLARLSVHLVQVVDDELEVGDQCPFTLAPAVTGVVEACTTAPLATSAAATCSNRPMCSA
jgi:hypothetical protein